MYRRTINILLAVSLSLSLGSAFAQQSDRRDINVQTMEPFQVFDNVYFVGIKAVASYVIETSDGLILIDTLDGFDGFTDKLLENIRTVGLNPDDIKHVIVMQAHRDHYGGLRELKPILTNATIGMSILDWERMEGDLGDQAVARDMIVEDRSSLTLGDTTLNFEHTPGHTAGTTSIIFSVFDDGQEHLTYFHGGSAIRTDVPDEIQRFIDDLERIQTIPNIEVTLINHHDIVPTGADDLFARAERLKNRQPGEPHPWVAPDEWQRWLTEKIAESYGILEEAKAQ
ncbi:MAG: MBL fold metallo-hydrolase [Proteobacteria bacterium]|jgi:metallo-beta-lactamase class B|nr:MBL fold metallo-hydrolase [Pseudomonadota bacterium]